MQWDPPEELVSTDPYCPAVRATSSDDTPLVVESSEELPASGQMVEPNNMLSKGQGGTTELTHM
jgi:hypothetical protein